MHIVPLCGESPCGILQLIFIPNLMLKCNPGTPPSLRASALLIRHRPMRSLCRAQIASALLRLSAV
ncbi:Hypothetical protein GbCGDNIH2_7332 [Granulibacter bethesdensis]|nr:Hypothetical protein GbCGDNIH2_7332 [Granulibacter bethesdensis]